MSFTKRVSALAVPASLSWGALCLGAVFWGCPANSKMSVPPGAPARIADSPPVAPPAPNLDSVDVTPDDYSDAGVVMTVDAESVDNSGLLREGSVCTSSESCQSGLCEGGCDAENPAVCVAANRTCRLDRLLFCSCEGEIFSASSSCPGRRFRNRGKCKPKATESP